MNTEKRKFRMGDVVKLRHVNFPMTVESVQDRRICGELVGEQSVGCIWFTKEGELIRDIFYSECLLLERANND